MLLVVVIVPVASCGISMYTSPPKKKTGRKWARHLLCDSIFFELINKKKRNGLHEQIQEEENDQPFPVCCMWTASSSRYIFLSSSSSGGGQNRFPLIFLFLPVLAPRSSSEHFAAESSQLLPQLSLLLLYKSPPPPHSFIPFLFLPSFYVYSDGHYRVIEEGRWVSIGNRCHYLVGSGSIKKRRTIRGGGGKVNIEGRHFHRQ